MKKSTMMMAVALAIGLGVSAKAEERSWAWSPIGIGLAAPIQLPPVMQLEHGESVAVNGVCLTYEDNPGGAAFSATTTTSMVLTSAWRRSVRAASAVCRFRRCPGSITTMFTVSSWLVWRTL